MKRCSRCGRTYSDESFIYCLDDGTSLSASYDLDPTLIDRAPSAANLNATDVLPPQVPRVEPSAQRKSLLPYLFIGLAVLVVGAVAMAMLVWSVTNSPSESTGLPARATPADPNTKPLSTAQIDISGLWKDNFGNISQISQQGDSFQLTSTGVACKGSFESSGRGTISGSRIDLIYRTNYSQGQCQGTVSADGMQITSACFDSVCGQFQPISYRRK